MRINTNTMALAAQRNLNNSANNLSKSIERLSSGLRINRAGDDAAGLVISQKLSAEVSGLKQGVRNAQDGISFTQTAEGSLDEVGTSLERMRTLVVQARNGTQDVESRDALRAEYNALSDEITRIGSSTEFAGKTVFSATAVDFQVGNGDTDQISVTVGALTSTAIGGNDITAHGASDAAFITDGALGEIDAAIAAVSTTRGSLGAVQNRLESTVRNLTVTSENLAASQSRIRDVDVASEMIEFTKNQILQQASTSMLAQANSVPQAALKLLG